MSESAAQDYGMWPTIGVTLYPARSKSETLAEVLDRVPTPLRQTSLLVMIVTNDPESLLSASTRAGIASLRRYAEGTTHPPGALQGKVDRVIR